jgi:Tol biopolymer transport system component
MYRIRNHRVLVAAATVVALAGGSGLFGSATPAAASHHPPAGAAAATAPIDGRIVYNDFGSGEIYTANPDGSAIVQVTHVGPDAFANEPSWTPGSRRIEFESNLTGDSRLYVVRADGTHQHMIATDRPGFEDLAGRYTPDGKTVFFARCQPDPPGGCAIYSVRADGTHRDAITHYRTGTRQGVDFRPAISRDGSHIAFERFDYEGITVQVWVARIDGSHAHPVTPPALEAGLPAWTPDGRHLLVSSNFAHLGNAIYVVDAFGHGRRLLTGEQFPNNDSFGSYSPSGRRIAFISDRTRPQIDGQDIYVMKADGSRQHLIIPGQPAVGFPQWGSAPLQPARAASHGSSTSPGRRLSALNLRRELEPWTHLPTR